MAAHHTRHLLPVCLLGVLVASGCQVGPDYHGPPKSPIADGYTQIEPSLGVTEDPCEDLSLWWTQLNDPTLNRLVADAADQNLSLREAAIRVYESRARAGTVESRFFPQIDMDGSYNHQRRSGSNFNDFPAGFTIDLTTDNWSWGTNLGWEVDVFGRIERLVEAAETDVEANRELLRNTMVLLYADVARNYVDVRTLQSRIDIVERNIVIRERTLTIAEARTEAGTRDHLDLAQAEGDLESAKGDLPTLRAALRRSLNRLSILLGRPPGEIDDLVGAGGAIPVAPASLAVGIPAELLRRRPDIRQAERRIAAQTARVGAAVGELYPRFSVSGTFGLDAQDFSNIMKWQVLNGGIGPSFRWDILNFGRIRGNIAAEQFVEQRFIVQYQAAVLSAAEEVDNALVGYVEEKQRRDSLQKTVDAYSRAAAISERQYQAGKVDLIRVLDSQRALLLYENQLVQSHADVTRNVILLYRALGGGWTATSSEISRSVDAPPVDAASILAPESVAEPPAAPTAPVAAPSIEGLPPVPSVEPAPLPGATYRSNGDFFVRRS